MQWWMHTAQCTIQCNAQCTEQCIAVQCGIQNSALHNAQCNTQYIVHSIVHSTSHWILPSAVWDAKQCSAQCNTQCSAIDEQCLALHKSTVQCGMQSSALVSTQSSPRHRFLNVTQKKSDEDKDHFHSAHSSSLESLRGESELMTLGNLICT